MNDRIKLMLDNIRQKKHHHYRQFIDDNELLAFTSLLEKQKFSDIERSKRRLSWVLTNESPVILPEERIVFTRTIVKIPDIFTANEWIKIKNSHYIHELGRVCNISSNFEYTIKVGLEKRRQEVLQSIDIHSAAGNKKGVEFLQSVIQSIDDVENLSDRYAQKALEIGRKDIYSVLQNVPRNGAKTLYEALQFFRILHFTLWANGNYHNTVGRFDQYMFRYLENDLNSGVLDDDSALELIEEFFLTFNKDSDMYVGMQQGDNGQSMVLGGIDINGDDSFNALSKICLTASLELKLIDPKINMRVNKNTQLEIYDLGTKLTKVGLGFPQYSNDDVVIPGLLSKGYSPEDAHNYVVAACWEFIISGYGMDIPNITALSFTKVVNNAISKYLVSSETFEILMEHVKSEMSNDLDMITSLLGSIYFEPAPFQSLLMNDCIENAKDISLGNRYNNYGIHGTGISNAIDSLAAVKKFVFEDQSIVAQELIDAIDNNFEGYRELWLKIKHDAPKMGKDDDFADNIAIRLLDDFADLSEKYINELGGCFRPGSGSAMYYLWHANEVGASADGRKKGDALSTNFSPSLNIKLDGPISIIRSFSKPNMKRIMNGGPLTLELHDSIFRNSESHRKVSALIKSYMDMGGHQLQINAVNREQLLDAKIHPENYKNLIVRVWGWSGYFIELEEMYQDHIISRIELNV